VYESPNSPGSLAIQDGAFPFSFGGPCDYLLPAAQIEGQPKQRAENATNRPPPRRIPKSVYQRFALRSPFGNAAEDNSGHN
jgi:hypothetical protein